MPHSEGREAAPEHVQDAVRASKQLNAEHHHQATPLTRLIATITNGAGSPLAIVGFVLCTSAWLLYNITASHFGRHVFDEPPFHYLEILFAFIAVLLALIILATQQHENMLSEERAKMTFELAILSEQKSAKIIEMLDRLRRDMPGGDSIEDHDAIALAAVTDPQAILDSLGESRRLIDDQS